MKEKKSTILTTLVTSPDIFITEQKSILVVGELDLVMSQIGNDEDNITIYNATDESSLDWIAQCYEFCDICILNTQTYPLFTGYLITKVKTSYYGTKYMTLNQNYFDNPIEICIKWLTDSTDIVYNNSITKEDTNGIL
jgi:hypothetical protein